MIYGNSLAYIPQTDFFEYSATTDLIRYVTGGIEMSGVVEGFE